MYGTFAPAPVILPAPVYGPVYAPVYVAAPRVVYRPHRPYRAYYAPAPVAYRPYYPATPYRQAVPYRGNILADKDKPEILKLAVSLALIAALVWLFVRYSGAQWGKLFEFFFDFKKLKGNWWILRHGLGVTLLLAVISAAGSILVGLAVAALRLGGCQYVELIDLRGLDYRFLQRGPRPGLDDIVIVAVDDASLNRVGRWPWSRVAIARLLDRLSADGAAVVGFDIVHHRCDRFRLTMSVRQESDGPLRRARMQLRQRRLTAVACSSTATPT